MAYAEGISAGIFEGGLIMGRLIKILADPVLHLMTLAYAIALICSNLPINTN